MLKKSNLRVASEIELWHGLHSTVSCCCVWWI